MFGFKKEPIDFGCQDGHIWIQLTNSTSTDSQCLKCGLTSWNSLTYNPSEQITREEWKKTHAKS